LIGVNRVFVDEIGVGVAEKEERAAAEDGKHC
jgi:hypothetical protein